MASFNDLPIELLHRIIELSVEDAIAVTNQRLRRQILLQLSLVSKAFTQYSQVALWRNIIIYKTGSSKRILEKEIAEDKIVEKLELLLYYEQFSKLDLSNLKIFLNRLKKVDSLVFVTSEASSSLIKFDDLLETPSLKEIKSLALYGNIPVNLDYNLRPPSLQHLDVMNFPENDDFVSKIIEASSNTLTSLHLAQSELKSYSTSKTFDSIKRYASRLTILAVSRCGNQLPLDLLPLCFSLKSLTLDLSNSFDITISALNSLSPSSQVESLEISMGCLVYPRNNAGRSLVGNEDFNSFITTLDLPQFRRLKYLYLDLIYSSEHEIWKAAVKSVLERVDFVEKLEKRGIKLEFGTETRLKILEEKRKQLEFKRREVEYELEVNSSKVLVNC